MSRLEKSDAQRLIELHAKGSPSWITRVRNALLEFGNVPEAAQALGISERTLRDWLRKAPHARRGISLRGAGWKAGKARGRPRKKPAKPLKPARATPENTLSPKREPMKFGYHTKLYAVVPNRYAVVAQEWEKSETGHETRPDGVSLHTSSTTCKKYCKNTLDRQNELPGETVPHKYSRPSGEPYLLKVEASVFDRVKSSGDGLRLCAAEYDGIKRSTA